MAHIVIIEDEDLVGKMMKFHLVAGGHNVTWFKSAEELEKVKDIKSVDLIIMDEMLPGISGTTAIKKLRVENIDVPVLMVTALDSQQKVVEGFNSGADDYLTKPFGIEEFKARVMALLKRGGKYQKNPDE